MRCSWIKVRHADQLAFESDTPALSGRNPAAVVLVADNARATVRVGGGLAAAWFPLRDSLTLDTVDGHALIERGRLRITCREDRPAVTAREGSAWQAIIGNGAFWRSRSEALVGVDGQLPLPVSSETTPRLAERMHAVARAETGPRAQQEGAIEDLRVALLEAQSDCLTLLDACPGRTRASRAQVLSRLMRVRLRIEQGEPNGLDLPELARIASYSASHLVRVFHRVFGVPPHEFVIQERMRRAIAMLENSGLAVAEVVQATGMNNHSTLARQLRARLGCSASELRSSLAKGQIRSRNAQWKIRERATLASTNS